MAFRCVFFVVSITLVANTGTTQLAFDNANQELGTISYEPEFYTAVFTFANKFDHPVIIEQISPSCGCVSVDYPKDAVKPGARDEIRAAIDLGGAGLFSIVLRVKLEHLVEPIILECKGRIGWPPIFVPAIIEISGLDAENGSTTGEFVLQYDVTHREPLWIDRIVSTLEGMDVRHLPERTVILRDPDGQKVERHHFRYRIDGAIDPHAGSITIAHRAGELSLPIRIEQGNGLSVSPSRLFFGTVSRSGGEKQREMVVSAIDSGDRDSIEFEIQELAKSSIRVDQNDEVDATFHVAFDPSHCSIGLYRGSLSFFTETRPESRTVVEVTALVVE